MGDMAVSNALGSNVFDICIGLGVPYLIFTTLKDQHINMCKNEIVPSILTLLAIVVLLFAVFVGSRWVLHPQSGYVLFLAYLCFVAWNILDSHLHIVSDG